MLNKLNSNVKKYLLKEQYRPSFIGLFLNPFYFARKAIYKNIKIYSKNIAGITLDIGCGSKPYENLFATEKYVGMDVEVSGHKRTDMHIDVFYDGIKIPFENNYFDSIVCFEVLEHVFNPEVFLSEAIRVLKPGGVAIFTVPFVWDEHESPFDYARYTSFGLKYLFEKSGFNVLENKKYLCDLRLLSLLTNAYIYKIIRKLIPSKISLLLILPLTTLNNIIGHIFYLFPKNIDLYFGNIFLLKKITMPV
ncbi:MAG: class I SAM-dependent methyltransferase [Bacteroidales bacterium]|nr:class I SAM-dependent methyltransferase [Bacteroidales bacterium]